MVVRADGKFAMLFVYKIIKKIKWFLLIEKDYLIATENKGLHFCTTELGIRLNYSDYLWS